MSGSFERTSLRCIGLAGVLRDVSRRPRLKILLRLLRGNADALPLRQRHEGLSCLKPWAVKNKTTGRLRGCHATEVSARKQVGALQVHVEDASRSLADKQSVDSYGGDIFRSFSIPELVRDVDDGVPRLRGKFAIFNKWVEVDSALEGHFMERIAPGAFRKTVREAADRIKVLFSHGKDPYIGYHVLGNIEVLREDDDGMAYEVRLFDDDVTRRLMPGLQAGAYGASFRADALKNDEQYPPRRSDYNPKRLPEVTRSELKLKEFGPTPFPMYAEATAVVRSLTDDFAFMGLVRDPAKLREVLEVERAAALDDEEPGPNEETTPDDDVSRSTQQPEAETRKEDPPWLLRR
jgi:HK97 family phage prohead protease